MIAYPPALRRTGFGPPRAIRHFTDAIAEARAGDAPDAPARRAPARVPVRTIARPPMPRRRIVLRLWLPLTPLFLLLAPFALLLAPLFYFAPRSAGLRPIAGALGIGRVLLSLGGTDVDVDAPGVRVQIKIF